MANELDSFLGDEAGVADPVVVIDAGGAGGAGVDPAAAAAADPAAGPAAAADPAKPAVVDPAKPAEVDTDDVPEDLKGTREALLAERAKRRDHKGRADRAEGELTATKAALEEATRKLALPPVVTAPAAAAVPAVVADPPAAPVVPNPIEDPAGFAAFNQRLLFNERLNLSEAMLRDQLGDAEVDAKLAVFKAAAAKNPALMQGLRGQPHPYKWMHAQAVRISAMDEIGDDPAAFRERIKAEARAELEAEAAGGAAPVVPAAGAPVVLPRSLATASSAAPRMTAVEAAPEFDAIFDRSKPRRSA